MQILNGGSFVGLDSAEKIEQLVFTAKQIAQTAIETEGFVNIEANNRQIALDIWQGAEYMTREHEEAQIKNIFVKNFLEELRELRNAEQMSGEVVSNNAAEIETDQSGEKIKAPDANSAADERDEFLGFVAPTESENVAASPEVTALPVATPDETTRFEDDFKAELLAPETTANDEATNEVEATATDELESETAAADSSGSPENLPSSNQVGLEAQTIENEVANAVKNPEPRDSPIGAIVLPEKEPYQFDKCTVTATIQMLPVEANAERRKVVLSVRTHDFAPQISIVEIARDAASAEITPALERAFESYRANLPLKVMDKLKREKSNAKRQPAASKTTASEVKNVAAKSENSSAANQKADAEKGETAKVETGDTVPKIVGSAPNIVAKPAASPSAKIAAPKTNRADEAQGSLFGF